MIFKLNRFLHISSLLLAGLVFCQFTYAQGPIDQPKGEYGWASFRNLTESSYKTKLEEYKKKGYRPVDVEILGGSTRRYSIVFRKNKDNRRWALHTKLTHDAFSAKWNEYKNKKYRLVDQESYVVGGKRYYAGVWMQNKEGYAWASFRNLTSSDFSSKFTEYKNKGYMPLDVDAYAVGNTVKYSIVWVKSKQFAWAEYRNIAKANFGTKFKEMSNKGYRLADTESYRRNGKQEYATIWVKDSQGWKARRDMNSTSFHNWFCKYRDEGFRVADIEAYKTSSGTRYAATWVRNNDNYKWEHRKDIADEIDDYLSNNSVPGLSVAIAEKGKIKFLKGYGHADIGKNKEAHSRTIFRLASVSKGITGLLAFMMEEDDDFDITKTTRSYETDIPNHHTHTVGQLLANRGRIRAYLNNDPLVDGTDEVYANALDASELFSDDPLRSSTGYFYSTHGYTLAAAAMEAHAETSFPNILWNKLSDPHGLTTLKCENHKVRKYEHANIYDTNLNEIDFKSLSWKYAGGGMESSSYDLVRLGIKLLQNRIISEDALDDMTTNQNGSRNYAFGWNVASDGSWFAKRGGQPGSRAYMRLYPDDDIVIVILANAWVNGNNVVQLAQDIADEMRP
ncbi:MAG: serine hydrolase [Bacteroidota bacterium]